MLDELSTKLRQTPDLAQQRALAKRIVDGEFDQVLRMWVPYDHGSSLSGSRMRMGK